MGSNDASMYQLQSASPAIGVGRLINGSADTLDYLFNNGGQDYFGNPVSDLLPPNIGAFNGGTAATPGPPDLVITEIMYNSPESGADSLEFIEIYNNGTSIVDLTDLTFSQGVTHTFAGGLIESGSYFVVASNATAYLNTFGLSPDAEWSSGVLSNGGEAIVLIDAFGQEVDAVNYDDSGSWPSGSNAGMPDGGGSSIVICDPTLNNNDGVNWLSCSSPTGIFINGFEVLASPGSPNIIISTDIVSACDAYTWTDGVTYSSVNYNVPTSIDAQTPSIFQVGQNSPWNNIYTACVVGDGNNGAQQVLEINITDLPAGANYRVLKTVANGNWFIGNPQPLVLGINTLNVNSVAFERAVKFQFDDGSIEFEALSLNQTTIYSSIPSQVLSNVIGCDSLVTLDLSLDNSTAGIHTVEACDAYTWIDGNTYTSSNNAANIMLSTAQGCDSTVTLNLTIIALNVGVELIDELTLQAETDVTGVSYQWVDCNDDFAPILGETGDTFTTEIFGDYGVQLTANECMVMSDCFTIPNTVHIDEEYVNYDIQLFPNPTSNYLNLALQGFQSVDIELMDLQGKVLRQQKGLLNKDLISLASFVSGVYFIKIYTSLGDRKMRIVLL